MLRPICTTIILKVISLESDDEEESEDCMEHCASDSWSDEEVNKTEMTEIATKAASTGRTMRTRRDGPLDVDALIDLME